MRQKKAVSEWHSDATEEEVLSDATEEEEVDGDEEK